MQGGQKTEENVQTFPTTREHPWQLYIVQAEGNPLISGAFQRLKSCSNLISWRQMRKKGFVCLGTKVAI